MFERVSMIVFDVCDSTPLVSSMVFNGSIQEYYVVQGIELLSRNFFFFFYFGPIQSGGNQRNINRVTNFQYVCVSVRDVYVCVYDMSSVRACVLHRYINI